MSEKHIVLVLEHARKILFPTRPFFRSSQVKFYLKFYKFKGYSTILLKLKFSQHMDNILVFNWTNNDLQAKRLDAGKL